MGKANAEQLMGAYKQMEESRNKTNNILMGGPMGHPANTDFYGNAGGMSGSYNVVQSGGNHQMYLSMGPHQMGKAANKGMLQGGQTH